MDLTIFTIAFTSVWPFHRCHTRPLLLLCHPSAVQAPAVHHSPSHSLFPLALPSASPPHPLLARGRAELCAAHLRAARLPFLPSHSRSHPTIASYPLSLHLHSRSATHVTLPHSSPSSLHTMLPLSLFSSLSHLRHPHPSPPPLPQPSSLLRPRATPHHSGANLKHRSPAANPRPLRLASSPAIPPQWPHTANPFAVLSDHHPSTQPSTRRLRRYSLPSSCPPPPTASPTSELCLQASSPSSKASAQLAHPSHKGLPSGSGCGESHAATPRHHRPAHRPHHHHFSHLHRPSSSSVHGPAHSAH